MKDSCCEQDIEHNWVEIERGNSEKVSWTFTHYCGGPCCDQGSAFEGHGISTISAKVHQKCSRCGEERDIVETWEERT